MEDQLERFEYNINANTEFDNKIEAVSEKEFLIHLYMDSFSEMIKELPLSKDLKDALTRAEKWKSRPKKPNANLTSKEDDYDYQFDDAGDYDDVLSSGASLFSGDIGTAKPTDMDPYGDLFVSDEDKPKGEDVNSPVDDLLNFFDEE